MKIICKFFSTLKKYEYLHVKHVINYAIVLGCFNFPYSLSLKEASFVLNVFSLALLLI